MMQLKTIMVGQTPLLKLNQLPEKIGKWRHGRHEWLATMRTWIAEGTDSTRIGEDIVIDRLTFAAVVRHCTAKPAIPLLLNLVCFMLQAIPHLSLLRDRYIGLASEMNQVIVAGRRN